MNEAGQAAALRAYARTKNRAAAAVAADVSIGTIDRVLRENADFREAFEQAGALYVMRLEEEAYRRGHDGVPRQKALGSGDNMTIVEELQYSDAILLRLLERHEKLWRKGEVREHEGQVSAAISLDSLTATQRARLREILDESSQDET